MENIDTLRKRIEDSQSELNAAIAQIITPLQRVAELQARIQVLSEWLADLEKQPEEGK